MFLPIFLMRGIPGSGKSTYIKRQMHPPGLRGGDREILVASDDHYFDQGGVYRFNPARLSEAHAACLHKFATSLSLRDPSGPAYVAHSVDYAALVVDNTFTTALELAPYVSLANAYGIRPEIVTLHIDAQRAFQRNKHGVPLRTIERMFDTLERSQVPTYWNAAYTDLYANDAGDYSE